MVMVKIMVMVVIVMIMMIMGMMVIVIVMILKIVPDRRSRCHPASSWCRRRRHQLEISLMKRTMIKIIIFKVVTMMVFFNDGSH